MLFKVLLLSIITLPITTNVVSNIDNIGDRVCTKKRSYIRTRYHTYKENIYILKGMTASINENDYYDYSYTYRKILKWNAINKDFGSDLSKEIKDYESECSKNLQINNIF